MCPADTSAAAWKVFLDIQRRLSPDEKLAQAIELSMLVRQAAEAGLRERYPDAGEKEISLRAIQRMLSAELFAKVYGAVVLVE